MIRDRVVIQTVPTQLTGKTIIIGDIHGCLDEFDNLLKACDYRRELDRVITVGDLVNKGYNSRGVVQRCLEIGALGVVGNHDDTLLECVRERGTYTDADLRDPVKRTARKFPVHLTDYLKSLPHILKIPQYNLIVAHAGINPYLSLEEQDPGDLTNMRRVMADGKAVRKGSIDGTAWAKVWSGPETVVFGHDAKAGLQQEEFALGLDTGCCYGDRLTAVVYPGKKLISVPGANIQKKTPKTAGDSVPVTPVHTEGEGDFGLMTPSMVRTNSRPAGGGTLTPGSNTPQTQGNSPPPQNQWPTQPVNTSSSQPLPGLIIGGAAPTSVSAGRSSQGERTPPTIKLAGGNTVSLGVDSLSTSKNPPTQSSSTTISGNSSTEVQKLKRDLLETRIFSFRVILSSKQVKLLFSLLAPGEIFEDIWLDFVEDMQVPEELWKDTLRLLANGLSAADTSSKEDQETALNLMQDILNARDDVKEAVATALKAQLQGDQVEGKIKADRAFKATMVALK